MLIVRLRSEPPPSQKSWGDCRHNLKFSSYNTTGFTSPSSLIQFSSYNTTSFISPSSLIDSNSMSTLLTTVMENSGTPSSSATELYHRSLETRAVSTMITIYEAGRSQSSKRTWDGKQKEFIQWCASHDYPDSLVTEQKLLAFLIHVKDRPRMRRGRKRKSRTSSSEIPSPSSSGNSLEPAGPQTHAGYVCSIMNLWRQQYAQHPDRVLFPVRPPCIKAYLQSLQRDQVAVEDATYQDRGIGTLAEYNVYLNSRKKMSKCFWDKHNESGLKLVTDFNMSYALISRGANIRSLKLSTIGSIFVENMGPGGTHIFRTTWRRSKKNQFGKHEQNTAIRHVNVEECPLGSLALYFFYRYNISKEPWPDFSEPKFWYDHYMLPSSRDPTKMMPYSKSYLGYRDAQVELGIETSVKTQGGRKHSSSAAENAGAFGPNVDKAGHWKNNSKDCAYSNNTIQFDVIQALAGSDPKDGSYFIRRAIIVPPPQLIEKVFPGITLAKEQLKNSISEFRKSEIAGESFLALMDYLSIILLQDAAMLMAMPDYNLHPVFDHELFKTQSFETFALSLREAVDAVVSPSHVLIQDALPAVASSLRRIDGSCQLNATAILNLEQQSSRQHRELIDTVKTVIPIAVSQALIQAGTALQVTQPSLLPQSSSIQKDSNIMQSTTEPSSASDTASLALPLSDNPIRTPTDSPAWSMNRAITTVPQAWEEYLKEIVSRDSSRNPKWMGPRSSTDGRFYSRREPLWREVKKRIQGGEAEATIISNLEDMRRDRVWTLRKLCDELCKKSVPDEVHNQALATINIE